MKEILDELEHLPWGYQWLYKGTYVKSFCDSQKLHTWKSLAICFIIRVNP